MNTFILEPKLTAIMRKLVQLTALFILGITPLSAQVELGIKLGLHSTDITEEGLEILDGDLKSLELAALGSQYGINLGVYSKLNVLGLFIEPAVIFNSTTVSYKLSDFTEGETQLALLQETYNNLDIPVHVGMKFFFLRAYTGPVAHVTLNSRSDLTSISGFIERFNQATYGWQIGAGIDILKFRLSLTYETNLSRLGNHISIGNNEYAFDQRPSRVIALLGIKF